MKEQSIKTAQQHQARTNRLDVSVQKAQAKRRDELAARPTQISNKQRPSMPR